MPALKRRKISNLALNLKELKEEEEERDFSGDSVVKSPPGNVGDTGSIPVQEDPTCHRVTNSVKSQNGNPLQCSCLENPRDGGAWRAAVCGAAQSRTRLKRLRSSKVTSTGPVLGAAAREAAERHTASGASPSQLQKSPGGNRDPALLERDTQINT